MPGFGQSKVLTGAEASQRISKAKTYGAEILDGIHALREAMNNYTIRDKWAVESIFNKMMTVEGLAIPYLAEHKKYMEFRNQAYADYLKLRWQEDRNERFKAFMILQQWMRELIANLYIAGILNRETGEGDVA